MRQCNTTFLIYVKLFLYAQKTISYENYAILFMCISRHSLSKWGLFTRENKTYLRRWYWPALHVVLLNIRLSIQVDWHLTVEILKVIIERLKYLFNQFLPPHIFHGTHVSPDLKRPALISELKCIKVIAKRNKYLIYEIWVSCKRKNIYSHIVKVKRWHICYLLSAFD